jgi:hypothetical protein
MRLRFPVSLLSIVLFAVTVAASDQEPVVSIAVENISLASIASDRVQLSANVSLLSSRKVTLHEVMFAQLNASGIQLYASPISQRLVLLPNQKVMPAEPLLLTVYFRDLSNLKPLHSLVEGEKVSITGMAYANVDLTPAQKLFLRTSSVRVPMKIDSAVELRIPGGAIIKAAALALISHAQEGLENAGSAWQTSMKMFSEQRQWLWKNYAPVLVLAHATYQLHNAKGATLSFETTAMGFRIRGYQVVLPKSVLEPWKFDPYIAASMKEDGSLKVSNYDLTLWPANARLRDDAGQLSVAQAWRFSTHQVRLLPFAKDDDESMFLPIEEDKTVKVRVHRRQSAAALGLVEITDPSVSPMRDVLADPVRPSDFSRDTSLAVFRFPDELDAREANPRLLLISARQDASSLELDTPIDSTGWGSPVISLEGIVGVVTSENSVISITEVAKVLNFDANHQSKGSEH